jgi:hypothetical protein
MQVSILIEIQIFLVLRIGDNTYVIFSFSFFILISQMNESTYLPYRSKDKQLV